MSLIEVALAAARRAALGLARLFLRTPLEQAALDAAPAALRLAEAAKAYFATPQGASDKALFEKLAAAAGAAMRGSAQDVASMPDDAPPPPPAGVVPGLGHGGDSMMRGE